MGTRGAPFRRRSLVVVSLSSREVSLGRRYGSRFVDGPCPVVLPCPVILHAFHSSTTPNKPTNRCLTRNRSIQPLLKTKTGLFSSLGGPASGANRLINRSNSSSQRASMMMARRRLRSTPLGVLLLALLGALAAAAAAASSCPGQDFIVQLTIRQRIGSGSAGRKRPLDVAGIHSFLQQTLPADPTLLKTRTTAVEDVCSVATVSISDKSARAASTKVCSVDRLGLALSGHTIDTTTR